MLGRDNNHIRIRNRLDLHLPTEISSKIASFFVKMSLSSSQVPHKTFHYDRYEIFISALSHLQMSIWWPYASRRLHQVSNDLTGSLSHELTSRSELPEELQPAGTGKITVARAHK